MKKFPPLILLGLLLASCSPAGNKNVENEDMGTIAARATGVFVDNANKDDSVLFYFEKLNDTGNEYWGFVTDDFMLTKDGFLMELLSPEDRLVLFKRDRKVFVRTIPFVGDSVESEVVFFEDARMRVGEKEFEKVKGLE